MTAAHAAREAGAGLAIRGRFSRLDGFALKLDLSLPATGVSALVGTSGSGKSTVLRIVAGLEQAPSCTVTFDGRRWDRIAPHLRPFSMTLQQPALFPHLTVLDNLRAVRDAGSIDAAIERFGLSALTGRKPHELSGGQQQRVALARAFLKPARLWLLDEPLSALDAVARRQLAPMVARMCRDLGNPVVYVTHSLQEVLQVADYLVILEDGQVIGAGAPEQVAAKLDHPLSPLIDSGAILDCEFVAFDAEQGLSRLRIGEQQLWIRGDLTGSGFPVRVQIPARDVGLATSVPAGTSFLNCLPVTVTGMQGASDGAVFVDLDCAGQALRSRITRLSQRNLGIAPGVALHALIKSVALDVRI